MYILYSGKDKQLYTGFTHDLKSRYKAHVNGFVSATKYRRPLVLIYYEAYVEQSDAKQRETYLKGGKGKKELKIQLRHIFEKLKYNT